jgi:hypothetical protein
MKAYLIVAALAFTATSHAASTGQAFYGDPPDDRHPWCIHDWNRPQPPRVEPGPAKSAPPPEGAVVLFDGTEATLSNWEADKEGHQPTKWVVRDGAMECVPKSGYVRTKQTFGDCQLHVEWAAPTKAEGDGQGRGNSGIFLPGGVEVQVLDNYNNPTYADGFACSVYGVNPPAANALRPPGEFQQIDITYRRPIYKDGKCIDPGYVTVYCNGALVQDKTQLEGPTGHRARTKPGPLAEGPLKFQDHGNPVRFRNVWLKPLPARTEPETGIHGPMSAEAAAAKRKEIAATVREKAAALPAGSQEQMLRCAESLVYEKDEPTLQKFTAMATEYAGNLKKLPEGKIAGKKDEVKQMAKNFQYLVKAGVISADFAPKADLDGIIKKHGWDKEKKK